MKSLLNNNIVRRVREEVGDLRKKPLYNDPNTSRTTLPPGSASYSNYPAATNAAPDPYSHTANSTAGYSQNRTYPSLPTQNYAAPKQSLSSKIESTATSVLGMMIGDDTIASASHRINNIVTNGCNARERLKNGVIVQFVSKSSGNLLQVVMSPYNFLVFDGNGSPNSFNTYFTVEQTNNDRYRFHNNYNYLAFENKEPCILSFPPGPKNNPNIDFRVHDLFENHDLILLESCGSKGHYISIAPDGHLKTLHNKQRTVDSQFSVVLIPYPQPMVASYQNVNTNQYGTYPVADEKPNTPSQAPLYPEPSFIEPSAPPPPYSAVAPNNHSSTSSSLYPKFQ